MFLLLLLLLIFVNCCSLFFFNCFYFYYCYQFLLIVVIIFSNCFYFLLLLWNKIIKNIKFFYSNNLQKSNPSEKIWLKSININLNLFFSLSSNTQSIGIIIKRIIVMVTSCTYWRQLTSYFDAYWRQLTFMVTPKWRLTSCWRSSIDVKNSQLTSIDVIWRQLTLDVPGTIN